MDENQIIDDAFEALRTIRKGFRGQPIADLAGDMAELMRPTMAFDTSLEEARRRHERTLREFVEEAGEVIAQASGPSDRKKQPSYKTPVFKCLGDYDLCCKHRGGGTTACAALLVLCVSKHLIPFVRHE